MCFWHVYVLTLFVTFLHELGHAIAALLTGGHVISLQVNTDGSGVTTTSGGIRAIVEAGGYLGSIVFGNIMLYVGVKHKALSSALAFIIALTMVMVSVVWFSTLSSLLFTIVVGIVLMLVSMYFTKLSRVLICLCGLYSVAYVIYDYNVGPTSDISAFAQGSVIPAVGWMYTWLVAAVLITAANVYFFILKSKRGR